MPRRKQMRKMQPPLFRWTPSPASRRDEHVELELEAFAWQLDVNEGEPSAKQAHCIITTVISHVKREPKSSYNSPKACFFECAKRVACRLERALKSTNDEDSMI